ncbi:hypothetical protein QM467_04805 [Rhodoblastus sp. 17X3]|uniref:hypothetical protein n=1 Tax=Rhodoblastus sp. 17X3 TaxID=3047026 RepID=UPI0024B84BEF|nr:hypothetical protein [Rhodoblastus sp. 17X3]MDI9847380.1 hypothetical protein [Rhodoblastus sp. 17X3]
MSNNIGITPVVSSMTDKEGAINSALGQYDAAISELASVDVSAGNVTLTAAQWTGAQVVSVTGATTAGRTVTGVASKRLIAVQSAAANTQSFSFKIGTASFTIAAGTIKLFYADGTANGLYAF